MSTITKITAIARDRKVVPFLKHKLRKSFLYKQSNLHDSFSYEDLITEGTFAAKKSPAHDKPRYTFFVPDFGLSSGGHMTIFRIMKHLEGLGFRTRLFIFNNTTYFDKEYVLYRIKRYYTDIHSEIALSSRDLFSQGIESNESFIASSWATAYFLQKIDVPAKRKYYLVQDYEPYFYSLSSEYHFAEGSYRLGLQHICASSWLSQKLQKEHSAESTHFNLGFDKNIYKHGAESRKKSVIFYARAVTPRRGFELGMLALSLVKKQMPDVDIQIFGWSQNPAMPFTYTDHGVLSHAQLAHLYRTSSVGLSLSLTNVSLIPVEMMACGLPVVELNHPSITNNFEHGKHLLVSDPTPESIAKNMLILLNDDSLRRRLAIQAEKKVSSEYSWEKAFADIEKSLIGDK